MLPVHQVRKGKTWPANLFIDPETKVVQGHLGGQSGLKAGEIMGPFAIEIGGMNDRVVTA